MKKKKTEEGGRGGGGGVGRRSLLPFYDAVRRPSLDPVI
jgi:hypothetical protein